MYPVYDQMAEKVHDKIIPEKERNYVYVLRSHKLELSV